MLFNQAWEAPKVNPVADVLLRGADLIEKHGHAKGIRRDENGSMCFLGAIEEAQGRSWDGWKVEPDTPLTKAASEALVSVVDVSKYPNHADKRYTAADWNNDPKRTAQNVIDAMRLAASVVAKTTVAA